VTKHPSCKVWAQCVGPEEYGHFNQGAPVELRMSVPNVAGSKGADQEQSSTAMFEGGGNPIASTHRR
jgi:hypothetical protein